MAEALLSGFLSKKAFSKENIAISDVSESRLGLMENKFGVRVTQSNLDLLKELKIIVLSVKP
jgi:pyrroline-5-carboxylate reductase